MTSAHFNLIMEIDLANSSDSEGELVIDETIILSSGEEESCPIGKFKLPGKELRAKKILKVTSNDDNHWSNNGLYQNFFNPESISSSDMKDELFIEETYTCAICNELFKYNVGLICHMETEHKQDITLRAKPKKSRMLRKPKQARKITQESKGQVPSHSFSSKDLLKKLSATGTSTINENLRLNGAGDTVTISTSKKACDVCKKLFSDQNKLSKHQESCLKVGLNFKCVYCKCRFGWESKYKKHLFRTHKLNAAVICKLCSSVFSDMDELATHSSECDKKLPAKEVAADEILSNNDANGVAD